MAIVLILAKSVGQFLVSLWGRKGRAKPRKSGSPKGWGPEGWGPGGPKGGAPKGGGPKISRFFFPSPATVFYSFFHLFWSFSWEFWWCLKRRDPQMCTFGVLGLSCASPGGRVRWGRRGFTQTQQTQHQHQHKPHKHTQKMDWPKMDWPKLDWPKLAKPLTTNL